MPSPFHQKYSTQNHRVFGKITTPESDPPMTMNEDRRGSTGSTSSMGSASSPPASPDTQRRRSSTSRFANLEALKRPQDNPENAARRASYTDTRPPPGLLGSWWHNFTRGPTSPPATKKDPRDTTTLRQ